MSGMIRGVGSDPGLTFGSPAAVAESVKEGDWLVITVRYVQPSELTRRALERGEWARNADSGERCEVAGEVTDLHLDPVRDPEHVEITLTPAGEVKPFLLTADSDGAGVWDRFLVHEAGSDGRGSAFRYIGVLDRIEQRLVPADGDRG